MRTIMRVAVAIVAAAVVVVSAQSAYSHTTLFAPNGGEQLTSGDQFSILWEVSIAHNLENWDLWFSTESADGPWTDVEMDLTAGDPNEGSLHSYNWLLPELDAPNAWVRVRMDNEGEDYFDVSDSPFSISSVSTLTCDFTSDNSCGISDLNELLLLGPINAGVAVTNGNEQFDLNGDQQIDNADVDLWLADAAAANGLSSPYKRGDANLNGVTDGQDFVLWNAHKFAASLRWDHGDFTGDGAIDGADFVVWNGNKFSSSFDSVVPEPGWLGWLVICPLAVRKQPN